MIDDALAAAGGWRAALARMDAATRLYDLEVDGLDAPLWVESFIGHEAVSELSDYRIHTLSTDAAIELERLRWRRARLRIRLADGSDQTRSGHVRQVRALRSDGGLARYELRIAPWNWLLTQQSHSRIWQDQPLAVILGDVFSCYPDAQWRFADGTEAALADLAPRACCMQYRETDHAFVQRLLAEEGLGWFLEEPEAATQSSRLVIFADSTQFQPSAAVAEGVRFHRAAGSEGADAIRRLDVVRRLPTLASSLVAFDPRQKRSQSAATLSPRAATPSSSSTIPRLERYRWQGHGLVTAADQAERRVRLMQEALDSQQARIVAEGNVRVLRAGDGFQITQSLLADAALSSSTAADGGDQAVVLSLRCAGLNNLPSELRPALEDWQQTAETAWLKTARDECGDLAALGDAEIASVLALARDQGYGGRMQLQPSSHVWRPAQAGERCGRIAPGPQSAVVVDASGSATGRDEIHRDRLGRIRVRFHWQQDPGNETPNSSPATGWLRVASRAAGPGRGVSFVPRLGQEVLVGFLDHDIDQPIVLGALYNGKGEGGPTATPGGKSTAAKDRGAALYAQAEDRRASAQGNSAGGNSPAWHGHSADADGHQNPAAITGYKTQAFAANGGASDYNQLALDDRDDQQRVQFKTTQATTELNLGHLIHQADNHRGSNRGRGFELRTDASGVIRAARGVLIESRRGATPMNQPEAIGDFTAGVSLIRQAHSLVTNFDEMAVKHLSTGLSMARGSIKPHASRLDSKQPPAQALSAAAHAKVRSTDAAPMDSSAETTSSAGSDEGTLPHLGAAIVALSARAQLGVIAGQDLQMAAGETIATMSGGDIDLAAGGSLAIHMGQSLGFLAGIRQNAENPGLTAIAAGGPLIVQAQNSTINLDAKQELKLVSVSQSLEAVAKTAITLTTQAGATIKIEGGNIEVHCPGQLVVHAASHAFERATQLSREMNSWPTARFDERVRLVCRDGSPAKNFRYIIRREDGASFRGVTDDDGWTMTQKALGPEEIQVELLGPEGESDAG